MAKGGYLCVGASYCKITTQRFGSDLNGTAGQWEQVMRRPKIEVIQELHSLAGDSEEGLGSRLERWRFERSRLERSSSKTRRVKVSMISGVVVAVCG